MTPNILLTGHVGSEYVRSNIMKKLHDPVTGVSSGVKYGHAHKFTHFTIAIEGQQLVEAEYEGKKLSRVIDATNAESVQSFGCGAMSFVAQSLANGQSFEAPPVAYGQMLVCMRGDVRVQALDGSGHDRIFGRSSPFGIRAEIRKNTPHRIIAHGGPAEFFHFFSTPKVTTLPQINNWEDAANWSGGAIILAGVEHKITTLSDESVSWCVYSIRTPDGEVTEEKTGWEEAFA